MHGDGFGAGRCAVQARGGAEAAGRRRRRRAAAELLGVVLRAQARVDVADVTLQDVLERRPKVAVEPAHAQTGQSVSRFIICKQKDQTATYTHTHTHPFNGPLSGTTRVSRYQKGETNLDFTEARDSERQWHQLGHMQVCT